MTHPLLADVLNQSITDWLEKVLVPLGIRAAGLAPDTSLEELLRLEIPAPNSDPSPGYADEVAGIRCSQSFYFGSLQMAAQLAGSERADLIRERLQGLMWRDGVTLGLMTALYSDLSEFGPVDDKTSLGLAAAEARWEAWEATNEPAKAAIADFFSDYLDLKFLYERQSKVQQHQPEPE